MKKNMGWLDRGIRIVLAAVVLALYLWDKIAGVAAIILGVLALIFLLTGVIGSCPLYVPFKLSTRKEKQ